MAQIHRSLTTQAVWDCRFSTTLSHWARRIILSHSLYYRR